MGPLSIGAARVGADLLRYPGDEALDDLHREVQAALGGVPWPTATDITLDEIRVELVYPEDEPSERFFRALVDS